jgi:hypothetical protein
MADGTLEPVRCGASNRCDYCAMFAALEAALVLKLDAQIRQPTVGLTTTTRRPDFPLDELRKAEKKLWDALRKGRQVGAFGRRGPDEPEVEAFPDLQYVGFLEWTTGEGTHSGGHRRPHIHHLTKGIPADHPLLSPVILEDAAEAELLGKQVGDLTTELEQRVSELWRRITGDAFVVECRPLRTPAGAIAYLALHHHKKRQAPPPGFTGRRLRPSKGYYEKPIAELRLLARELASHERVVIATKRAIGIEVFGDQAPEEWEQDANLTHAIVEALRDMAAHPSSLQLSIEQGKDFETERKEFVARTCAELERIRKQRPPELVRVREKLHLDKETGVMFTEAVAVLGPVTPKVKNQFQAAA